MRSIGIAIFGLAGVLITDAWATEASDPLAYYEWIGLAIIGAVIIIGLSVVGIRKSRRLTAQATAGSGMVPKYLSYINLTSWVMLGVGIGALVFSLWLNQY
jgi:predicted small integral membrane protein